MMVLAPVVAAFAMQGCWGDIEGLYPDSGWDGTDTGDPPVEPELIEGGGTGGGPIDGRVGIHVRDEATREPVAGARILLLDGAGAEIEGETDVEGLAVLEREGLEGPVDVHILGADHVLESVYALDSAYATFLIRPRQGLEASPSAAISGVLSGLDLIPEPETDQYRIARVFWGPPLDRMATMRDPGFDPGLAAVADVLPDSGEDTYTATVAAGPGRLYVLGGLVRTWNTADTSDDTVGWTHIGLLGGLDLEPGDDVHGGMDLELEMALLLRVLVRFAGASSGSYYDRAEAHMGLDFGEAGTVWFGGASNADSFAFEAPNYYGEYAEGDVVVVGVAAQNVAEGEEGDPVAHLPMAYTLDRGMDDYEDWLLDYYDIEGAVAQAAVGLEWDGEVFSCFPPMGYSFGQFTIIEEASGAELWRVTRFGDLPTAGTALPQLPGEWGWQGASATGVRARVWVTKLIASADPADMRFDDFAAVVSDVSINEALFE